MPRDEDEEDDYYEEGGADGGASDFAMHFEDALAGDARFELVETLEPGPLEDEACRVRMIVRDGVYFFVSVLASDEIVRVGLAVEDVETSEAVEREMLERSASLTEFVEEAIGTGDELEHEVRHFEDDAFYFCSEIPYDGVERLGDSGLRGEVSFYLDKFVESLLPVLEKLA